MASIERLGIVVAALATACNGTSDDAAPGGADAGAGGAAACAWHGSDPGGLVASGAAVGDVIANLELYDQCGEKRHLWDFAGGYHVLYMTAVWCGPCRAEVPKLAARTEELVTHGGVPFSYIVLLAENVSAEPPAPDDAATYAEVLDVGETLPVVADPSQAAYTSTPWDGHARPGKLVLSPEMKMLDFGLGYEGDDLRYQVILDDASGR